MAVGLGTLGLAPVAFWAMTPRELDAAVRGRLGGVRQAALPRASLDAMMTRFPDQRG